MSAAIDIRGARRRRLLGLAAQMGLSPAEAAALLVGDSPSVEYRNLIGPAASKPAEQKKSKSKTAARQSRYKRRRALGLRVLRANAAVDDEKVARLMQAGIVSDSAADSDADLLDELVRVAMEIADALEK